MPTVPALLGAAWCDSEVRGMFIAAAAAAGALERELTVRVDGVSRQYHVVTLNSTSPSGFNASGSTLHLEHGPTSQGTRLWLARDSSLSAGSYVKFSLLGKSLTYDIDLNDVGCSCNAALYFVAMPGIAPGGQPAPGGMGNYYCDANKVGDVWCWEMDTIEANRHTMQVTPHRCSGPPGDYIASCDRAGSMRNSWFVNRRGLCPAEGCTIDSRRPFTHIQRFVATPGGQVLVRIENELLQQGRRFAFNATSDASYLSTMSSALRDGMVLTFQLWGSSWLTMSWLDFMTLCYGSCPTTSQVTYSDISITSL